MAFSGIKFFYTRTCKRDWDSLKQMKIQNVKALPEVLTIAQVGQIINACTQQTMAVYIGTVYSMGLSLQTTIVYLHLTETAEADARKTIERVFRRPRK